MNRILNIIFFNTSFRIDLWDLLASYFKDGKPLDAVIRLLYEDAERHKEHVRKIYRAWIKNMAEGKSFADIIAPHVSRTEYMLIHAGEKRGNLAFALENVHRILMDMQHMKRSIWSNLSMPMLLAAILLAIIFGVGIWVIPIFETISPRNTWSPFQQLVAEGISIISSYWYVWLLIMITIVMIVMKSLGTWQRPEWVDKHFAPWTLYRDYQGALVLLGLSGLVANNVPVYESIKIMYDSAPAWTQRHLKHMMKAFLEGAKVSSALTTSDLFTRGVALRIRAYADSPHFAKSLELLGKRTVTDTVKHIERVSKILNALLILLVMSTALFLLASMIDIAINTSNSAVR